MLLKRLNEKQANNLINEEMTSKYLAENLGNQEFVNEPIETTERNTIEKVIDWIDNRIEQVKNLVTGNTEGEYWRKVRENVVKAYNSKYQGNAGEFYSKETTKDGIHYIKSDNSFLKDEYGNDRSLKEAYKSLISQDHKLDDGTEIKIVEELPRITDLNAKKKGMYNEVIKRQPKITNKGVKDIKALNQSVNSNLKETIEQSKYKNTKEDVNNRHLDYGIISFDTREVYFYNTNDKKAYKIEYSIANKTDGTPILYAKKSFKYDKDLTEKINKEMVMSRASKEGSSQSPSLTNNSIANSENNVNTTQKNNVESQEGSFNLPEKDNQKKYNKKSTFDEYLKEHTINKEVGDTIKDVKLPIKEKVETKIPVNIQRHLDNEINTAIENKTSKGKVTDKISNKIKSLLGINV